MLIHFMIPSQAKEITMERQELVADGYGRVLQVLEKALDGLSQDDLNK